MRGRDRTGTPESTRGRGGPDTSWRARQSVHVHRHPARFQSEIHLTAFHRLAGEPLYPSGGRRPKQCDPSDRFRSPGASSSRRHSTRDGWTTRCDHPRPSERLGAPTRPRGRNVKVEVYDV